MKFRKFQLQKQEKYPNFYQIQINKMFIRIYKYKYIKLILSILLLTTLFLFYFFHLVDPTNILIKGIIGYIDDSFIYYQIRIRIIFSIFFLIILILNTYLLLEILYDENFAITIKTIFIFIFILIIILAPSISNRRIWSSDSIIHLYIIKLIIENKNLKDPKYNFNDFAYQGFFYHNLLAKLSLLTGINPHFFIIYIGQIIQYIVYFIGMYLITSKFFKDSKIYKNNNVQSVIFFISIVLNLILGPCFINTAPFNLIVCLTPILIYLLYKISFINSIYIIIINIIVVLVHVYGYIIVIFSVIGLFIRMLFFFFRNIKGRKINSYKYILLINFTIYLFTAIIILFPEIIINIISVLPISNFIKEYIILNWNSGGTFIRRRVQESLYNILIKFCQYAIVFFVFFFNFFENWHKFKKKIKFQLNFESYFKFFIDISSIFIILSLFYGADLLFYRILTILIPFYLFLFLIYIIVIKKKVVHYSSKQKIKHFIKKKQIIYFFFVLVVSFSLLSVYDLRGSYTKEQYDACNWINENLPENSEFVTTLMLEKIVLGLTMRDTTRYMYVFYNDFDSNDIKVSYHPESKLFIFIDLDPPRNYELLPSFKGLESEYSSNVTLFIQKLNSTKSYYTLVYDFNNILIYEILR